MDNIVDLNDSRIMSAAEATRKWNLDDSSLRKRIKDFPEGSIRKFGKQWVVTVDGMKKVFGQNKTEDE